MWTPNRNAPLISVNKTHNFELIDKKLLSVESHLSESKVIHIHILETKLWRQMRIVWVLM